MGRPFNERPNQDETPGAGIPKPKKFFKSRNNDPPDIPAVIYSEKPELSYGNANKKQKVNTSEKETKTKKFFSSKSTDSDKTVLSSNNNKRTETKPPIVLRICRGKSQLLNDSDESESTPTPSSTPSTSNVTSPRTVRDNPQRSPNARITRSTRRSMQQDLNNSPAKADTPSEFSLFTSPKNDLSPQYIPAEKYELERKAMYDNLLRPNSPSTPPLETDPTTDINSNVDVEEPVKTEGGNNTDQDEADMEIEEETARGSIIVPDASDTSTNTELVNNNIENINDPEADAIDDNGLNTTNSEDAPPKKTEIEDDWSTDEDSNSTTPEVEMKEKDDVAAINPSIEEHKEEILEKILEKPTENPAPVKLLISKKKGSIFKSRSMVADGSKKRRALYKHKWCDGDPIDKKTDNQEDNSKAPNEYEEDTFGFQDDPLLRVSDNENVTGVKCTKNDKGVCFTMLYCLSFFNN